MFTRRMPRRKSKIWTHFAEIDVGKTAKCSYCSKIISIACGSFGNLSRHLRMKHSTDARSEPYQDLVKAAEVVYIKAEVSGQNVNCNMKTTPKVKRKDKEENLCYPCIEWKNPDPSEKSREIDDQLLRMIVKEYHSFGVVEDPEFKAFVSALCPGYSLPSRKTLSRSLLPQTYMKIAEIVNMKLESVQDVCLCTDSWTNVNNQNFMTVSAHFINPDCKLDSVLLNCVEFLDRDNTDNIAEGLRETVCEWGLEEKVIAVVSDSASDIVASVHISNWPHLTCFAHAINQIVQSGLFGSEISITVNKVKSIVDYFSSNSHALSKLYSVQKHMGLLELKLKKDVSTRWNSTYNMMKRILEMKETVIHTLAFMQNDLQMLSDMEWKLIETTVQVLQVFREVTDEISSENNVPRSKVILFVRLINKSLLSYKNHKTIPSQLHSLVTTLKTELDKYFEDIEENELSAQSTLLDPRFKKYGFSEEKNCMLALESLKEEVCCVCLQVNPPSPKTDTADFNLQSTLWNEFDSEAQNVTAVRNPVSAGLLELDRFLQEPLLNRKEDPLKWWKERRSIYPNLYEVVKKRLCLMSTSVPSKRLFCKAGQVINDRRSNITSSKLSQILFLHHNY